MKRLVLKYELVSQKIVRNLKIFHKSTFIIVILKTIVKKCNNISCFETYVEFTISVNTFNHFPVYLQIL